MYIILDTTTKCEGFMTYLPCIKKDIHLQCISKLKHKINFEKGVGEFQVQCLLKLFLWVHNVKCPAFCLPKTDNWTQIWSVFNPLEKIDGGILQQWITQD